LAEQESEREAGSQGQVQEQQSGEKSCSIS